MEALPLARDIEEDYELFGAGEAHPFETCEDGSLKCHCERCARWLSFVNTSSAGRQYEVVSAELVAACMHLSPNAVFHSPS